MKSLTATKYLYLNTLAIIFMSLFIQINYTRAADNFPADPSKMTISVKNHTVGRGKTISNLGYFGKPYGFDLDGFLKMNPDNFFPKTQVPLEELRYGGGPGGLLIAGKIGAGGRKIVSCGEQRSDQSSYFAYEFFPTGEPWDSIWVVDRDEVVDIPYFPNYKGISDQDFVCRFSDYKTFVPDQVAPLGVDVIWTSHVWGIKTYDLWNFFQFYIIPQKQSIKDMYVAWTARHNLGINIFTNNPNDDDIVYFDRENKLACVEDQPGWDGDGIAGPVAYKFWPPDDIAAEKIKWTFFTREMISHYDSEWYDHLSSGRIDPPNSDGNGTSAKGFLSYSCGPFDVDVGDTLHIRMAVLVGEGLDGVIENMKRIEKMMAEDFAIPTSPPSPPLRIEAGNHQATLKWDAHPNDKNPETWTDKYREDFQLVQQPFEGYRIYKSFTEGGPWTLLGEYDVPDNEYGENTGLIREFTDLGLLNNVVYYYCVTAFSKPDQITGFPELESAKGLSTVEVIPGTQIPETVGKVFVVPNPYRSDLDYSSYKPPWEIPDPRRNINDEPGQDRWTEHDRKIQFVNLPNPCVIRVYTSAGDLVNTFNHDDPNIGIYNWNLTSSVGQTIASGIYLYTVEANSEIQVGKFVVIK